MSYVDLKHLLADLALEAVRDPERAVWAAVVAAYGALAEESRPTVPWVALRRKAEECGRGLDWHPTVDDAQRLVERGLLTRRDEEFTIRQQFLPVLAYLRRQTSRLLDALKWVHAHGPQGDEADLQRGVALFNAGLYFECHELLEGVWRATPGSERAFYHGIVQVAAAFYHYEKRNFHGARTLLTKGLQKLEGFPDRYRAVDLGAFRRTLRPWLDHFNAGVSNEPDALPAISLDTGSTW